MVFYASVAIFYIALPLLLIISSIFRPCIISGIYLLFFFVLPFVPVPTQQTIHKSSGIYLKLLLATSVLTTLSQIVFQIVLFSMPPYGEMLENCQFLEELLRHIGFVKFNHINPVSAITWISPEIIMLIGSACVYVACTRFSAVSDQSENAVPVPKIKPKRQFLRISVAIGKYLVLCFFCFAAILRPSVPGGLYFLVFIGATTWWVWSSLTRPFGYFLRCLIIFIMLHIVVLYAYQMQWPQSFLDKDDKYARYFGLTQLLSVNCSDPRDFIWSSTEEWASFLNPIVLLWLYYFVVIESSLLLKSQVLRDKSVKTGETTPLISGTSPSARYGSGGKKPVTILQDSTGSVVVTENYDDIPLEPLGKDDVAEEEKPTLFDNILFGIESVFALAVRSSYIFTNIVMMTWSITFHSWITFVLLLIANILWMVPNQRRAMLRFSPFLVFFACFLLISSYIFSMNLTDEELPQVVDDIDLALIGFTKVYVLPCKFLFIKCLFTCMFWITLKQYSTERKEARQANALAAMVAPLQVTVGTATGVPKEESKVNATLDKIGNYLMVFLTKFWIWIVAITLFSVAITGERMTIFRIVYMALFIFFVLTFQLSYSIWRKLLFPFWVTVILFSMTMLILVYTYQFKNIREYWETYLHVSPQQQLDIGLEAYEPKQLFIRLATPTFFIIITAIQINYFQKQYLLLSEPHVIEVVDEPISDTTSVPEENAPEHTSLRTDLELSHKATITEAGTISTAQLQVKLYSWLKEIQTFISLFLIYLEIHSPTIVMIICICMCIFDHCALHFPITILIIISFFTGRKVILAVIYTCSVVESAILLLRMLYQIEYINHNVWNVDCQNINETLNDADWLGFSKIPSNKTLYSIIAWNVAYIIAVTLMSVLHVRHSSFKGKHGICLRRVFYVFPEVGRKDADKNLKTCIKYLINFGYYKFGVEISLIGIVIVIGYRFDVYSVVYALWLLVLSRVNRTILSKIWNVFFVFLGLSIILQYFMLIGIPPFYCNDVDFPWDDDLSLTTIQQSIFLLSFNKDLPKERVLADFLLFVLIARQSVAFHVESSNSGHNFQGGSNARITENPEDSSFVNPVPDFITYCRSYLDIVKRAVFLNFIWFTLASLFLAGTQRVSVFSAGYLIGSFIFLWLGSDIYLRPLPQILKSWNYLLCYNILVIISKSCLQVVGCIYMDYLSHNACWMIHLFSIGCAKVGATTNQSADSEVCTLNEYVGLAWDAICFATLIIQFRIFQSYYFFHVVNETKATTILASRGADLIEELREKRIMDKNEGERRILEKIKIKMERIKAGQQKLHDQTYDTNNHFVDGIFPGRPRHRMILPDSHPAAIRSGDYYMFDEVEDDQLDLIQEPEQVTAEEEEEEREVLGNKPGLGDTRVVVIDPKGTKMPEPKPGTSKDEYDDDELSDISEPKAMTTCDKIISYLYFVWIFLESCCLTITLFLNKYSKDYRYVLRVLNKEKKILKDKTRYFVGLRLGKGGIWRPAGSYDTLLKDSGQDRPKEFEKYEDDGEMSVVDQPPAFKLLLSIWYVILSHSHMLVYFMIFLNQIKSATFLSLPLPMFVLFWGTLTVPRPTKTFWVTIIAYTEVIVLIKCMFQFDILSWNKSQNISPLFPPRIIGIEKKDNYALWDLLVLLMVFFHRFLMKSLGLWKSTYIPAVVLGDGDYVVTGDTLTALREHDSAQSTGGLDNLDEEEDEDEGVVHHGEGNTDLVHIKATEVPITTKLVSTIQMRFARYGSSLKSFFKDLLDPSSRIATDVYTYLFLCDFFNFFVLLIGYSSFGPYTGGEGVSDYLQENRVPVLFLLMLILQFLLILVDRAIFLRKYIFGKLIFQFLQIIFLHIWLFIIYPSITDRGFNSAVAPQMYYMVKCFYLLLSAYQIRSGYPTRVLGNFICRAYNYFNLFMFKGFLAIPFLFELRTVMDWMWTDTSMTVFDWLKMEDVFAHIFQTKCVRYCEQEFPQPRGQKKPTFVKYLMGGAAILLMIAIIWFPLVFFALVDAVGIPNPPYGVGLELRVGPYEPIYQMSVQSNSILRFNQIDFDRMNAIYEEDKGALTFLANYQASDVVAIKFSTNSASVWSISPPDRKRMIAELNSTDPMTVTLRYTVSHKSNTKEDTGTISESIIRVLDSYVNGTTTLNPVRQKILDMLLHNETRPPAFFNHLLPKFIKVTNKGTAKPVSQLMKELKSPFDRAFRDIGVQRLTTSTTTDWWSILELCDDANYEKILSGMPYGDDCASVMMYAFNEKLFPSTLNFITGSGIIGVYTTIVLVAGRLLRGVIAGGTFKIMFEDLPNVDRILQLCFDIYLVRESREFILEEDLFAKLIFLFRSPETLIKWTRPKEELNDEGDDDDNDDSSRK